MSVKEAVKELGYKSANNIYQMLANDKKKGRSDRYRYINGRLEVDITKFYYQENMSFQEIAARLGITYKEAKSAYESALKKIKTKLEI